MEIQKVNQTTLGVGAAVGAFTIWGFMPLYWWLLIDVSPFEIMGYRLIWSFAFLTLYLLFVGRLGAALTIFKNKKALVFLFCSGTVLAGNWVLYIWAVNSNQVIATSLGYYINPLLNILIGRLCFGDKASPLAWVAISFAFLGVAYQVYSIGSLPIVSLGLGFSFAMYGLLRKIVMVEALPGLYVESILLLPCAIVLLAFMHYYGYSSVLTPGHGKDFLILIGLGPLSTLPLLWFTFAARNIRLTTLGLTQYLAPTIAFLLGIFVANEEFTTDRLITFVCIWIALALYSWDSIRSYNAKSKQS